MLMYWGYFFLDLNYDYEFEMMLSMVDEMMILLFLLLSSCSAAGREKSSVCMTWLLFYCSLDCGAA